MGSIALSLFLKYGLPVLAVAGLVFGAYHWSYERGVNYEVGKYQPKIEKALVAVNKGIAALKTDQASIATLRGAINDNNRIVDQEHQSYLAQQKKAAQDRATFAKQSASTQQVIDGLQRASTATRKPCTQSDESKKALEDL